MKKVLIITYYWPPSGGSGVQRWLKMSKYLREFGWEPIIYTAEGGEMPARDESLQEEVHPDTIVIKRKIREPYSIYKKFVGQKKEEGFGAGFLSEKKKIGFAQKVSIWIRGNFFIPDARKLWIRPSIKFLRKYLKENPVDAIISTGPPHSMHLIALGVIEELKTPWIADFRDPWTSIDFYDQLMLSRWADKKHKSLERKVLKAASKVVCVSPSWSEELKELGATDVQVITNGYDHADFDKVKEPIDAQFIITHIGSMNKDRNPHLLWEVLEELVEEWQPLFRKNLVIQLIGKTDHTILDSIEKHGLSTNLKKESYMAHQQVIKEMARSSVMLLPINDTPNVAGVVPGKVFEYMAIRRPILCIGPPEGDAGKIIADAQAGHVIAFKDKVTMRAAVNELFAQHKAKTLALGVNKHILKYTRRSLAGDYVKLLNTL